MAANTGTIEIVVNGERRQVSLGHTITDLLRSLGIQPDRVAIELDRRIVKPPEWNTTVLEAESAIEIVQFVGGG